MCASIHHFTNAARHTSETPPRVSLFLFTRHRQTRNLTYVYDSNHKHAVKQIGTNYFCYDNNGNMTRRNASSAACSNGDQLFYDVENRMTQMITASATTNMKYNGDGTRVSREVVGVGTTYYIGNHYEIYKPNAGTTTFNKYYYFGSQRVAVRLGSTLPTTAHSFTCKATTRVRPRS